MHPFMVFIFKNNLCIVCVFLCTHIYPCVRVGDNFQDLDSPLPHVGFRITVHWTWWEVPYPPEPSDQTPSFVVSSEKLFQCPLTDRRLSPESFPFVLADMELFPWG